MNSCSPNQTTAASSPPPPQTAAPNEEASPRQGGAAEAAPGLPRQEVLQEEEARKDEPLEQRRWLTGPDELRERCGEASPNPNGQVPDPPARRDGSCGSCELSPTELPVCEAVVATTSWQAATFSPGQAVTVRGHVGLPAYWTCQGVGGQCACLNRCFYALRAVPEASDFADWPNNVPHHLVLEVPKEGHPWSAFANRSGLLYSYGDESSVCHPLRIPDGQRSLEVVLSGTISREPMEYRDAASPKAHRLVLQSICRIETGNGARELPPSGGMHPPAGP